MFHVGFYSIHLLTSGLGVGSLQRNGGDKAEDQTPQLANNSWKQLLKVNKDDTTSLKPWKQVLELKANKENIALAIREFMRQAWGKCYQSVNIYLFNLILAIQRNLVGKERSPGMKSRRIQRTLSIPGSSKRPHLRIQPG